VPVASLAKPTGARVLRRSWANVNLDGETDGEDGRMAETDADEFSTTGCWPEGRRAIEAGASLIPQVQPSDFRPAGPGESTRRDSPACSIVSHPVTVAVACMPPQPSWQGASRQASSGIAPVSPQMAIKRAASHPPLPIIAPAIAICIPGDALDSTSAAASAGLTAHPYYLYYSSAISIHKHDRRRACPHCRRQLQYHKG